jgi:hypothetical protein
MRVNEHLAQTRAALERVMGPSAPVIEVASHHQAGAGGHVLADHVAQHLDLPPSVRFQQAQVDAHRVDLAEGAGQFQHAMQQAAALRAGNGDIPVFKMGDRKF